MLALLLDAVGGVVCCWGGEKSGNLGLDLSLLGHETLQPFFVGQRVVEPWVGHIEGLSFARLRESTALVWSRLGML
jgi:hypothetical protein